MKKSKLNYHDRSDRMWSTMKSRWDNNVTDCVGVIFIEYDIGLSSLNKYCEIYDEERQDNDVIDHTSLLCTKNENELSCLIRQSTIYDLDRARQQCDWLYRHGLC